MASSSGFRWGPGQVVGFGETRAVDGDCVEANGMFGVESWMQ